VKVKRGQTLLLVNVITEEERECRVVYVKSNLWSRKVGVEFTSIKGDFWHVYSAQVGVKHRRDGDSWSRISWNASKRRQRIKYEGPRIVADVEALFLDQKSTYDIDVGFSDVTCIRGDGCGAGGFVAGAGLFWLLLGAPAVLVFERGAEYEVSGFGFNENFTPRFAFSFTVRCKSTWFMSTLLSPA
jgi:hypothetical protein